MNSIGTGIYLAASILDHSCTPNAVATFEGPQLSIRLIEDIPELVWDKIRISYIDQIDLPATRRSELKKAYYFDCDCERCADTSMESKMSAMACPNKTSDCEGFVAVTDDKCKECETEITDEHRQRFEDIMDMTQQALLEMQETRCKDQKTSKKMLCFIPIFLQQTLIFAEIWIKISVKFYTIRTYGG